jgi:hypothetical protein
VPEWSRDSAPEIREAARKLREAQQAAIRAIYPDTKAV